MELNSVTLKCDKNIKKRYIKIFTLKPDTQMEINFGRHECVNNVKS